MKLISRYNELVSVLTDVASVADDSLSSEDTKNIIFKCTKLDDGRFSCSVIGINLLITYKKDFMCGIEIPDEELTEEQAPDGGVRQVLYFQLKCKELLGFLNSYKSLRQTVAVDVIFEYTERKLIKCTVLEKSIEPGMTADEVEFIVNDDSQPTIPSQWVFQNVPLKPNLLGTINLELEQGVELRELPVDNVLFHTRNLLPLMQNGTNLFSYMTLDDNYAVVFNTAYTVLMQNQMAVDGVFSGIRLQYRAVAFMDKIVCNCDSVQVALSGRYIYFRMPDSEAFIMFDDRVASYQAYLEAFKKDMAIVVDRVYLKDVLKRLSLVNDAVEFSIHADEDKVILKNSKFEQEINILQSKAMNGLGVIKFSIMPDVLNKAIIGSDDVFSGETFVYYCPNVAGRKDNAAIVFADNSGAWFSVVKVKVSN